MQFQLSDPDPARRYDALDAISRNLDPAQLDPLKRSIEGETDPALRLAQERLRITLWRGLAKRLRPVWTQ